MKIDIHQVESIANEVDAMERQIASRADELHDPHRAGQPLDDWLAAERETIWRPAIEVRQGDDAYIVEAAVAGLEPPQIDVRVAPSDVLIRADVHHHHQHTGDAVLCEFSAGPMFRSYHFAHPVDPARTRADYKNGLLRITAPLVPARTP
ncbi:MAG: Hsp20/alpha crystallin family protein [Acidobacteria bacterium]|nr:Hsp20/alpha crystallin family protein [Acidobacteriota bacterium]